MCRPGHGSSRDPSAGGHTGPPLREGVFGNQRKFVRETDLAPTGRDRARPLQGEREWTDGGVRSPRPTEATLVVRSEGPMYLRHGFRRPNFGTKFGASVMGIGPYGEKGKHPQPPGPAAQSGAFAARVRGRGGDCGRDHPQRGHQPRAIPQSRRSRDSSCCT